MPRVMIVCPKTKKLVSTGMAMDKSTFETTTLTNNIMQCPACGEKHTWSKSDAILEE